VRTPVLTFFTGLVMVLTYPNIANSGPPMTGSSGDSQWLGAMNPKTWSWPSMPSMPSMPWGEEPARIQKKPKSVVANMNRSAKSGWNKTKNALNPANLFETDAKARPKTTKSATSNADDGFFGKLFKPEEKPKEIRTVNDFLSQPQPR
jgi:hypothetical protein